MSDLMLDVDQAGELKAAFRRGNWTNAQIKRFCQDDFSTQVREVIEGNATIVRSPLLQLVGSITCAPTAFPFSVSEHFVCGTGPDTEVKVSYLGDKFRAWFLAKTEEPKGETVLRYATLRKSSVDAPIITELGGEEKAETSLCEMFFLMEQQKHGEDGILLTNGYANIFYIKDQTGVLRTVSVYWDDGGWGVDAGSTEDPITWYDGRQVFSRNSC